MNSKKIVACIVGVVCVCMVWGALVTSAAVKPGVMEISEMLQRHPRKAPLLIYRDGKIWVIGGKAYYSHFTKWGQDGHPEYNDNPNVEYIDLETKQVVYTDLALQTENLKPKNFYHAIPFYTSEDSMIYIAGDEWLAKLDLAKFESPEEAVVEIDPGEKANWEEGSWGRVAINGTDYIVLVGEDGVSFFDIDREQFVKLDGMDADFPDDMGISGGFGGCAIDNVFYLFGGEASGGSSPEAWAFDPAQPSGSQWTRLTDMPVGIDGPVVVAFKGKAYITGGEAAGTYFNTVFAYDPGQNTYTRKTNLPFPTTGHSAVVAEDAIWIPSGYSWGSAEEGKYGFRMHPPYIITYYPDNDDSVLGFDTLESVSGEYMNMNLSWSDADHVTGEAQTITINWTASTDSSKGMAYYRKKGEEAFESVEAAGKVYAVAMEGAKSYSATLTGLAPDTEYEYRVVSEGTMPVESAVYTFTTQPVAPETVSFVVYGDTKAQYDINHELNCDILEFFNKNGHVGWFGMLGDFGDIGAFVEWNAWFNYTHDGKTCTKDLTAQYPMVPIHGNHESFARSFFDNVAAPPVAMTGWPDLNNAGEEEYWYSFNYGGVHVTVITTAEENEEEWYTVNQLQWLEADLAKAAAEKVAGNIHWAIVLFHHSPFTSGEHFEDQADYGTFEEGSYVDVIEKSGTVDVVFAAHDHDYERTKNIRGYRWLEENDAGDPVFYTLEGATAEEESGQFGSATQGAGTIWVTAGGAGAGQRDMFPLDELGESSHIAFRKPAPERDEDATTHPAYHYVVVTASPTEFTFETFEKSIAYLPAWEGADDDFTGLLDSVTIRR